MDVLKLNSQRDRHSLDPSVAIAYGGNIPDSATLDRFITYLPEDLKIPANQVLFENWDLETVTTIGTNIPGQTQPVRNAYAFKAYTTTTQAAATTAFNQIKRSDNAKFFNELRTIYTARTDKKPGATPPPTLAANADDATTNKALNDLADWIEQNIPPSYQLSNLTDPARTLTDMLQGVFGTSGNAILDLNDTHLSRILESLLGNIGRTFARKGKFDNKKGFIEFSLEKIKREDYWRNNWSVQYNELNKFPSSLGRNLQNQVFDQIALLWVVDTEIVGTEDSSKTLTE